MKNNAIVKLENQIFALEANYSKAVREQNYKVNLFALNNLIKKKKAELENLKKFEYLAK